MSVAIKLPELGENIESAQVTFVMVKPGDQIEEGQVIIEIETDKASIEVPAEESGIVKEVFVKEGDHLAIGATIITMEVASASEKKNEDDAAKNQEVSEQEETKNIAPIEDNKDDKPIQAEIEVPEQVSKASDNLENPPKSTLYNMPGKIVPAAPTTRRFARQIGVDINEVKGSGPGGRVSMDDVKAHSKTLHQQYKEAGSQVGGYANTLKEALPDFSKFGDIRVEDMSNIRKKTAEHLSYAWATVPQVTQFDKADITQLELTRKKFSKLAEKESGNKLTITAILLKIVGLALKKFPQFNTSIDMENKQVIYKNYYNIGVAVDTERGLIVPVIKDVLDKSIFQLSDELAEIAAKARSRKIGLEDLQGGNFSISNLGGLGGTSFTPIVNTPEVAILGISRGVFEPRYEEGEFVPKLMLPLSLTYDHRIIDGADAVRFIRWIAIALEEPLMIAMNN